MAQIATGGALFPFLVPEALPVEGEDTGAAAAQHQDFDIPTAEEIAEVQRRAAVCGDGLVAGDEQCDCGGKVDGFFMVGGARMNYCDQGGRVCMVTCRWE